MNEAILQACLEVITTLDKACLPSQIIIELHAPLRHEADMPAVEIVRRWLSVSIDELQVFEVAMRTEDLSGKAGSRQLIELMGPDDALQTVRRSGLESGLARFATVVDSDLIYIDYQWGALCGAGALWRYDPECRAFVEVSTLWMS